MSYKIKSILVSIYVIINVDHMGLNSFEHNINNKYNGDLRERKQIRIIRKNSNTMNRKIDSLENKIYKILVDTIINLQMDTQA